MAIEYSKKYPYVGFMEDDCAFVSNNWESTFIDKLTEIGDNAIVWGNDLIHGDRLVGLPFMDSNIVIKLGYMCPPQIKYLYADNFWLELGAKLNTLFYFNDIIIEHRHYSTGKRQVDNISMIVDKNFDNDNYGFNLLYKSQDFDKDLTKLQS
jgi:hypothetical protein